ncbi:MAG: peptidoglycan-binding protein [Clostridia bacterium]|nr:peptidoglycan-binding protein [Clostridia bacterium]
MKHAAKNTKRAISALLIALMIWLIPAAALAESWSAVIMDKKLKFYKDAALTEYAGSLGRGEVVVVEEVYGAAAMVSYKGVSGFYCEIEALENVLDIGEPAKINADGVKVYEKADTSSKSLKVNKGLEVIVLATDDKWALIEANGYGVYVYKGYLTMISEEPVPTPTPEPPELEDSIICTVTASSLNIYKKANTSSEELGTLKSGDEVIVMAYNSEWAYLYFEGIYGYSRTGSLKKVEPTIQPTPTPEATPAPDMSKAFPAVVSASSVKVYEKADASSTRIATLKKGAEVNVIEHDSTWAYIEKNGSTGYCKVSALEKVENKTLAEEYRTKYTKVQFTATVIYDNAPAYVTADTSVASSTFKMGDTVEVYGYSKNWAYIGVGESRCFIAVKHLSNADYTALKSGDSGANTKKLQETLEKLGYFDSEPTGSYSTQTTSAVRRFQSQVGLNDSGNADISTLRVLYGGYAPASELLSQTLKSGSKGDYVTRMQTRLYYLDYLTKTSSIDGDFGNTTAKAVKLFQSEAGLSVTGTADAATLRALYSNGAPKLPTGTVAADYVASGGTNPSVLKIPEGLESTQSALPSNPSASEKIEYVIYLAQLQLGKPYIYATAGPNSFDCSGLTVYCYGKVGVTLGRSAYAHGYNSSSGAKIESMSKLKRGDIVCFNTISDSDLVDHVGIYIGDGYFIHASSGSSNGRQVCVSNLNSGYYNRVFSWARRPIE